MKIRTLGLVTMLAMALNVSACTPEQEAKLKATITAIKSGVKVTTDAARQALDTICANSAATNTGAQIAIQIATQRGDTKAVQDINTAMATLASVCSTGNAASSSLAALALKGWAAYQTILAVQAAQQGAK